MLIIRFARGIAVPRKSGKEVNTTSKRMYAPLLCVGCKVSFVGRLLHQFTSACNATSPATAGANSPKYFPRCRWVAVLKYKPGNYFDTQESSF